MSQSPPAVTIESSPLLCPEPADPLSSHPRDPGPITRTRALVTGMVALATRTLALVTGTLGLVTRTLALTTEPGRPLSPSGPCFPARPCGPTGPVLPGAPTAPGSPCGDKREVTLIPCAWSPAVPRGVPVLGWHRVAHLGALLALTPLGAGGAGGTLRKETRGGEGQGHPGGWHGVCDSRSCHPALTLFPRGPGGPFSPVGPGEPCGRRKRSRVRRAQKRDGEEGEEEDPAPGAGTGRSQDQGDQTRWPPGG